MRKICYTFLMLLLSVFFDAALTHAQGGGKVAPPTSVTPPAVVNRPANTVPNATPPAPSSTQKPNPITPPPSALSGKGYVQADSIPPPEDFQPSSQIADTLQNITNFISPASPSNKQATNPFQPFWHWLTRNHDSHLIEDTKAEIDNILWLIRKDMEKLFDAKLFLYHPHFLWRVALMILITLLIVRWQNKNILNIADQYSLDEHPEDLPADQKPAGALTIPKHHFAHRLLLSVIIFFKSIVPLVIFIIISIGLFATEYNNQAARALMILAIALCTFLTIFCASESILNPMIPQTHRLLKLEDSGMESFGKFVRNCTLLALLIYCSENIALIIGFVEPSAQVIAKIVGILLVSYFVGLVYINRLVVNEWLHDLEVPAPHPQLLADLAASTKGNYAAPENSLDKSEYVEQDYHPLKSHIWHKVAENWHNLASGGALLCYLSWLYYGNEKGVAITKVTIFTFLIMLGVRAGYNAFNMVAHRLHQWHLNYDRDRLSYMVIDRLKFYYRYLNIIAKITLATIGIFLCLYSWDINSEHFFSSYYIQIILATIIRTSLVLFISIGVWETISVIVDYNLAPRANARGELIEPSARLRTFLPIALNVSRVVILAISSLMFLSAVNVDISPLLTTFGVFGVALSFGSQTLVKDFITGLFIFIENDIAIGSPAIINGQLGVVESTTLRTIKLKDSEGHIQVIPFNSINTITCPPKDYTITTIEIDSPHTESLAVLKKLLLEVNMELQLDKEYREIILEPLIIQGISKIGRESYTVCATIRTKPDIYHDLKMQVYDKIRTKYEQAGMEVGLKTP